MKKINIIALALLSMFFASCNDYLDIVPDGTPEISNTFNDRNGAESYLATCYSGLPAIGSLTDPAIACSDEIIYIFDWTEAQGMWGGYAGHYVQLGLQNKNNPYLDFWNGANDGKNLWQAIRNCNIFLENIDKVDLTLEPDERTRWIAEVKVLKAYYHYYLLRLYGPIPLIKENLSVEASTEETRVYREPFDNCVDYISSLIDEALPDLPLTIEDPSLDYGHITKPIALAIKAEMLLNAASPLFNGNDDYKNIEDNRGKKLFPQAYDAEKWKKAADAAKEAIHAAEESGVSLYTYDDKSVNLSETLRREIGLRTVASDRINREIVWPMTKNTVYNYQRATMPFLINDDMTYVPWRPMTGVTMRIAEQFYTENGVPIDEDNNWDYSNRYKPVVADNTQPEFIQRNYKTAYMNTHRELRYYSNIGFDGGYWYGNGDQLNVPTALKTKKGETSGKSSGEIRYSMTGMYAKKPANIKTTRVTKSTNWVSYQYSFPIIRLADLYLMYSEAMNEYAGPTADSVYYYIDKVRERAGLKGVVESWQQYSKYPDKPTTKEGFREIVHQERGIELCMEGKRYWDLRRWKTAHLVYPGPVYGWNVNSNDYDEYNQKVVVSGDNADYGFSTRDYLFPIKDYSVRQNTNLVQNPFWNN